MCHKFLLNLINLKIFDFLKNITTKQQYLYIASVLILVIVGLRFFSEFYHMIGLSKLFVFLALILFLIGGILNGTKIIMNNLGDFKNKYMAAYYCIQLIGIMVALIYFIFKFIQLALLLSFG